MFTRLGRLTVRRRRRVLVAGAAFFVLAGVLGGGVASHLVSGGFDDPHSESSRAERAIERHFGKQRPDLILLVTAPRGTVDDAEVTTAGNALTHRLAREPGVARTVSYWGIGSPPPLRSKDSHQALVLAVLKGSD